MAPSAVVAGKVTLGEDVSFWFNAVARGDVNAIEIGPKTNIQDSVVLHVSYDEHSLSIGSGVVVGHSAVLHGCIVEDSALIGIGAQVLDGAVVERTAQVGAGSIVTPGTVVPAGHLVIGVPARVIRPLAAEEKGEIERIRDQYLELKTDYAKVLGRGY